MSLTKKIQEPGSGSAHVNLNQRVVIQVFKDLINPSENIRVEATSWFLSESFPQVVLSAGWVPQFVWEMSRKIIEINDLTQRKIIVNEVIRQFKKQKRS